MTFGEIKDVVREHYGRTGWPTRMLDEALKSARREIEKYGNFYWMRDTNAFDLADGTATYIIGSAAAVDEANFKDARALHVKEENDTVWSEVQLGTHTQEEASLMFPTDEENMPMLAVLDNSTLILYPTPDKTYNAKLFFWQWTTNPSATTGTDEITNRFPEALIFGAMVWGCEQFKEPQEADRWRALFSQELGKIHRHALERERMDRVSMVPFTGPYQNRRNVELGRQAWL